MKTIEAIIECFGGIEILKQEYIKIYHEPYMPLVIEWIGQGPQGSDLISVAHTYLQNGDVMRDPEVVFCRFAHTWVPMTYQQDGLGMYQEAAIIENDRLMMTQHMQGLRAFTHLWDRNLKEQGFLEAILQKSIVI